MRTFYDRDVTPLNAARERPPEPGNAPRDGDERWHVVLTNPHSTSATSGPWFEKREEAEAWVGDQPEDVQARAMVVCDF